jgi:hypothetical protein
MYTWRFVEVSLLAAAALVSGCADPVAPARPGAAPAAAVRPGTPSGGRGLDAEFTRLAREVPGFGGMFYDASGTLNVYVARPADRRSAQSAATLGADVATMARARGLIEPGARGAVVREGAYDFLQLADWADRARGLLRVKGVVFTDIDESRNRLRVAITPATSLRRIETALAAMRVPREAVVVDRVNPVRQLATLRERVRPLAGGLQIAFDPTPEGFFICTLGFNARIPSVPGANFFVTASHCTQVQGEADRTPYFQPTPPSPTASFANRFIGMEFRDPTYGNPGGLCPTDFRCRFSDAALVRYAPNVPASLGSIYRTTGLLLSRVGSILIDGANPRWSILGEAPVALTGTVVNKVGRTTGWTQGPVIATCADFGQLQPGGGATGIALLCQDVALLNSEGGDSGAPIFQRTSASSGNIILGGILWGGGDVPGLGPITVYSAMENIESELGPLTTSATAAAPLVAAH